MLRLGEVEVNSDKNFELKISLFRYSLPEMGTAIYFSVERGDYGRLCSSVARAVDRQSKHLGSHPGTVKSVYFLHRKILKFFNKDHISKSKLSLKLSTKNTCQETYQIR